MPNIPNFQPPTGYFGNVANLNSTATFPSQTQEEEDEEIRPENPTRKSMRPNKQVVTIYDTDSPSKRKIGRKQVVDAQMSDDDTNQKITCPINSKLQVYKAIWIMENNLDKNVKCDVCMDDDDNEGDEIVICDGCNMAVHQSCYGRDILHQLP